MTHDTVRFFEEERIAHRAIIDAGNECEQVMKELDEQSAKFMRKAKTAVLGQKLGLPSRLLPALETITYGIDVSERQLAARLIGGWCRGQQ